MFYMIVNDGIIKAVGNMTSQMQEIDNATYQNISELLNNKPVPPDKKHDYRLTVELEWELFEISDYDDDTADKAEAYDILVGAVE